MILLMNHCRPVPLTAPIELLSFMLLQMSLANQFDLFIQQSMFFFENSIGIIIRTFSPRNSKRTKNHIHILWSTVAISYSETWVPNHLNLIFLIFRMIFNFHLLTKPIFWIDYACTLYHVVNSPLQWMACYSSKLLLKTKKKYILFILKLILLHNAT